MRGLVTDVITGDKFCRDQLRGFRSVGSKNGGLPLTWIVALTTGQHYRAACDRIKRTLYAPELSILALFGRRRVTHEPPERVLLGAG